MPKQVKWIFIYVYLFILNIIGEYSSSKKLLEYLRYSAQRCGIIILKTLHILGEYSSTR